jgi:hypothetical protein
MAKTKRKGKSSPARAKQHTKRARANAKPKTRAKPKASSSRKATGAAAPKRKAKSKVKPGARARAKPAAKPPGKRSGRAPKRLAITRRGGDDEAFFHGTRTRDDLAEELAEEAVTTMTTGEDEAAEARDRDVPEELGGPFVPSTGSREFARGTDASNPEDAEREPFPKT